MNIEQYYPNQFQKDLSKLSLKKPNSVILGHSESFGVDNTTQFFGGKEWENCVIDMRVSEYKNYFALSIFAMVCNDLNMYANFNLHYPKFRKLTNYPKFGWSGFTPHFESPEWLIIKPMSLGIANFENETIRQFATLWKVTIYDFFTLQIPEITPNVLFWGIVFGIIYFVTYPLFDGMIYGNYSEDIIWFLKPILKS